MATWRQERLNRNFHCYFPEGNIWLFISQMLHYVCSQLLTLTVSDQLGASQVAHSKTIKILCDTDYSNSSPSLTFTVNRRIYFHQNKSMFLENNYQLLFLPPELVFNFIHVSDKMQHEVAGQTISSLRGRQFAQGTAGGLKQGRYLFARLHIHKSSPSLSFLSVFRLLSLSCYLCIPPSQKLLMVITFCKTHLAAGK